MTTFEEFKELASDGNVVPVYETLIADIETPVSVYLKVRDESPYSFLLESMEGGDKLGRYSFVGFDPFMTFRITGKRFSLEARHKDVIVLPSLVDPSDHPLDALKKIFAHIKMVHIPGLPRLTGGAIGYFGYECAQLMETIPVVEADEIQLPDAFLMFCDTILVFDNVDRRLYIVSNAYIPDGSAESTLKTEYDKARRDIERIQNLLATKSAAVLARYRWDGALEHLVSQSEFHRSVDQCKSYIKEGDIFQVVLSQRVKQKAAVNSFDLFRSLRIVSPAPYMYYLRFNDVSVIGSSPEMLVRVEGGIVETRPIAGTRRRGKDDAEDRMLESELLQDAKERAEHLMLVDLGRNDVGRISEYGSVNITQFMEVERFSHVMHLVSSVQGTLRNGLTPIDALFACFPAGTLTGAPKIRAMEIIAELEPVKRGVYGGAVAYFGFSGTLDSCIAIRTIVARGETLYFQAGAGIVHDSTPEREYEETLEKLGGNLKALHMLRAKDELRKE